MSENAAAEAQTPAQAQPSPLVVQPVVLRHAEDAAFYWLQRNARQHSPLMSFNRLQHFDRLLDAHLDGLRIAGDVGWECAIKNLQRWKSAGEAFVAYVLALESGNKDRLTALWAIVEKNPDVMTKGLISALGWVEEAIALSWMNFWLPLSDRPRLQEIGLRAFAIRRIAPAISLEDVFASTDAAVRVAVCRVIGTIGLTTYISLLTEAAHDTDIMVLEAAAIALVLIGQADKGIAHLWKASAHWNEIANQSKGWTKDRAIERADRVARYIGYASRTQNDGLNDILRHLPHRQALLALGHRGDAAAMPTIQEAMGRKDLTRLAGWAFSHITGIDLDKHRLSAPPPEPDENEDERQTPLHDPDAGLPWPHPTLIATWWQMHATKYSNGKFLLYGKQVDDLTHRHDVLRHGVQAARWSAALNIAIANPQSPMFATDAEATTQIAQLASIATSPN
jgi:uncharacterized protein (TIGR02270 family)